MWFMAYLAGVTAVTAVVYPVSRNPEDIAENRLDSLSRIGRA
jgi:hypothetical protein